jgi:hypothetical protein
VIRFLMGETCFPRQSLPAVKEMYDDRVLSAASYKMVDGQP